MLKYEFDYTSPYWLSLAGLLVVYTVLSIFDYHILTGPFFEIDYWGAIYTMFLSMLLISMWMQRIKENRNRIYALLPISQNVMAKLRAATYGIPMLLLVTYMIVIHLILLPNWKDESSTLIGQTGLFFALFIATVMGRDIWIAKSFKNFFSKIIPIFFIAVVIIGLTLLIILILLPFLYDSVPVNWARSTFLYSKLIFFVMAFLLLPGLLITYKKRNSFLS